ncbi:MAG: V-type ATP synthase subunit E family protein [Chloroflexi bacterium]|nr:V-type ATP synthase subunit E family protein [Chloroflexota bacterium]MCL5275395.1 V-type ATP synthase subunit E family protein [Chloroflexota bacterium]
MRPIEDSIQALARAVQSEAQAEADQALADARAKAETIQQRAQEEAAAERAEILKRASAEAERIRSQAIATAQLKARSSQLNCREKLLDEVFNAVRDQLQQAPQWSDYAPIAGRLLREALSHLGSDTAQVLADPATQALLTAQVLDGIAKELIVRVQAGPALQEGIGVSVETPDGHRQFDNTLETRLNRLQSSLRSPVYRLLMGETL